MKKLQENDFHQDILRNHHQCRWAGLISIIGMILLLTMLIMGLS